jgi:hypothetical protein
VGKRSSRNHQDDQHVDERHSDPAGGRYDHRHLDFGGYCADNDLLWVEINLAGLFLVAATLICAIVSLATGSSWTTAGTVGIALIGVGQGFNIPLPMAAGLSSPAAFFGDKMSPLSDTTNLAPSMAGANFSIMFLHDLYHRAKFGDTPW